MNPPPDLTADWDRHPDDTAWLAAQLSKLPAAHHRAIRAQYAALYRGESRRAANLYVLALVDVGRGNPLPLSASDDDIKHHARAAARAGYRCAAQPRSDSPPLEAAARQVEKYGFDLPHAATESGILARLGCERWWRRKLRTCHARRSETLALNANAVNRRYGCYVSDSGLERYRAQKIRSRSILTEFAAVNELGESFTLADLVDRSVSNPRIRRAELMVRIAGLERIASDLGHCGVFYTVTCPSRMHASLSRTGQKNPRYDGTTPREAQTYLTNLWACIRAKIARDGLKLYGLRVAEPQHDGTPHWHLLAFLPDDQRHRLTAILRDYAMRADPDEPGADKHRFREVLIDHEKGTAAGYVAKYVSKNIDGYGLADEPGNPKPNEAAERVQAWASTWGIRQFQFFGSPPVTVWRELRRLDADVETGLIGEATKAADAGDWATFVRLMGGPSCKRRDAPIALWKRESNSTTRYGEPRTAYLLGLACEDGKSISRPHVWEVKRRSEAGVSLSTDLAVIDPWSTVNNCTQF